MPNRLLLMSKQWLAKIFARDHFDSISKPTTDAGKALELRSEGNKHLANERLSAAENCFREALRLNAADASTLTCLGYTLKELGSFEDAKVQLRTAITLLGDVSEAYEATYLIGQIAELEGDPQQAKFQYLQVLKLKPDFTLVCSDLRRLYQTIGLPDEIPKLLEQCAKACPEVVEYCYWYGNWLLEFKNYETAASEFGRLIRLQPTFAEAHNNRGICLQEQRRNAEAIESFTTAISLNPDLAQSYSNRGAIFMRQQQFSLAIADFRESIRLSPLSCVPQINLGEAMRETGQFDAALSHFETAIALDPADPTAYWNKSIVLLLQGKFLEGFSLYEYRYNHSRQDNRRDFVKPRWLGKTSMKDEKVLLYSEQGLGDTIQFCRYAKLVAASGAEVILEVQRPLIQLLRGLEGVTQIVERGAKLPAFDYCCPLMSLPHTFLTEEETIPRQERYLSVDATQKLKWSQRLGIQSKPLVGLVWSGSASHTNDHNRSIAFANLIAELPTCYQYVSLQQEVRPIDQVALDNCTFITHFGDELKDFTDTAALCDIVDLVISVDTSVAHLSAALGKPTFVLLSYSVDWRWMLNRPDSPWYPSARLYRQERLMDWKGAIKEAAADLKDFMDEKYQCR